MGRPITRQEMDCACTKVNGRATHAHCVHEFLLLFVDFQVVSVGIPVSIQIASGWYRG